MEKPMTLKEFVKTTLVDIMNAVSEAQDEIGRNSGKGNIGTVMASSSSVVGRDGGLITSESGRLEGNPIKDIEFDVFVTVSRKQGGEASGQGKLGGEIFMVAAKVEGEVSRQHEQTDSSAQRIKFSVPVFYNGTPVYAHVETREHLRRPKAEFVENMTKPAKAATRRKMDK